MLVGCYNVGFSMLHHICMLLYNNSLKSTSKGLVWNQVPWVPPPFYTWAHFWIMESISCVLGLLITLVYYVFALSMWLRRVGKIKIIFLFLWFLSTFPSPYLLLKYFPPPNRERFTKIVWEDQHVKLFFSALCSQPPDKPKLV